MDNYQAVFQRKEIKYLISEDTLSALMPVLQQHMVPDFFPHSKIGNLYYDTSDFRMIRRSLEKPMYKEKLRLRCYGTAGEDTPVFPEVKKKVRGIVYKRRSSLPYHQAMEILSGSSPMPQGQFYQELSWMLQSYPALAPRMYLYYERDSWAEPGEAGLRLTLDRSILWQTQVFDLCQKPWGNPLLPTGQVLMEVKVAGSAPLWLTGALSRLGIFPVSFSKYGHAYETLCKNAPQASAQINETMEMKYYA